MSIFGFNDGNSLSGIMGDARDQYGAVQTPNLRWDNYSPDQYAAQNATAKTVSDDPLTRSAQLSALQKMGDLSNTGLSAVDQQGYENARALGNQMSNSGTQAAMNNASARGIGGSGMEFAQREMANQAGAGRAQEAALQQSADSARQRALYTQAYGQGLGQMQQQQTGLNAQNAGILNQFNQANTQAQNQASLYNTNNQNQAFLANQQGRNNVAQENYNNQMSHAGAMAGADQGIAKAGAAESAANTAAWNSMMGAGMGMMSMGMGKPSGGGGGGGGGNQNQAGEAYKDYSGYA